MSDEYQLRKDVDWILSQISNLQNNEIIVVRFDDEKTTFKKDGKYLTIDEIMSNYYDKAMVYTKEEVDNLIRELRE